MRRRAPGVYATPKPLQDVHILDYLELSGSQGKAGASLAMNQSTVSRSVQLMRRQFKLVPRAGAKVCRYGLNPSLHFLRLAYQAHRLMEGVLRIATDPLHQSLLTGLAGLQSVPPCFRSGGHWAELIQHGLLDGAILSSFCLDRKLASGEAPRWDGLAALPLGRLRLQLLDTGSAARSVLLPSRGVAPVLRQEMEKHDFVVVQQPAACQESAAWLKRARDRNLALPLCLSLLEPGWIEAQGLRLHPEQPPLLEQLWLLVPEGRVRISREVRHLIRLLRLRLASAGEALLGEGELPAEANDPIGREPFRSMPAGAPSPNDAPHASICRHGDGDRTAFAALRL